MPIPTGQNKAVIPTANAVGTTGGDTGKRGILGEGTSGFVDNIPKGTLSNTEARQWYLLQEKKIAEQIDRSLPIQKQAEQAFNLRNQYRTGARELMSGRTLAEELYKFEPNLTWEEIVKKQIDKGLSGDDIYKAILESSQRSRTSVNKYLGLD